MNISFIYATDLHGDKRKYNAILETAEKLNIKIIHLGADLLPKTANILKDQQTFINSYLKDFYSVCQSKDMQLLAFFGNDDFYVSKKYFKQYASLLDETPQKINGYEFCAYPYVLDYPFGLKTACKSDYTEWEHPQYIHTPCDFNENGYYAITNIKDYFLSKKTIEEDLKNIKATRKTIMAMHMPPYSLDLDVCYDSRRVGSKSIFDWIEREQPLLVLCGHIHENFWVTNKWYAEIGKTKIIQPGQDRNIMTMVYIEVSQEKIKIQKIIKNL